MNAQIAQQLNISVKSIKSVEVWASVLFVRFVSGRPRFVSKKGIQMTQFDCIQVETFRDKVVFDRASGKAYLVRAGYDMGEFYSIKRFDPAGLDIRGLDFSTVKGEKLPDSPMSKERSAEYLAVVGAMSWAKPSLVAYGEPGRCRFPQGYEVA